MLFISSFSIISTFPHFIYGSGNEALALTKEYEKIHANASRNATDSSLCTKGGPECVREGSLMPQVLFFVAQLMWGIGAPLYGNLGMAYMDDNIKRSKTPVLISKLLFSSHSQQATNHQLIYSPLIPLRSHKELSAFPNVLTSHIFYNSFIRYFILEHYPLTSVIKKYPNVSSISLRHLPGILL